MSVRAYFVEYDGKIIDIDFYSVDMRLTKIPIILRYEESLIETTYGINVWIPTGETNKIDPLNPPLLYGTKDSFQLYYNNANEISMLFSEAQTLNGLKWIDDNHVKILLVEKMKIEQLEIDEIKNNRWLVYNNDRFPSDIHMIKYKMDKEMM